jgi:hypothetical protein
MVMLPTIWSKTSHLLSKKEGIRIYKTIFLPVVQNGCEPWSVTLREEYRLRMIENRVPRKIFGPKGDELHDFMN